MRLRHGSKKFLRGINRNIVLNLIKQHGAVSRAQLAELTPLAAPTISEIVAALIEEGLIVETETVISERRGPRPVLLALNRDGAYAVGVMLRSDGASFVVTDLLGTVCQRAVISTSPNESPRAMLAQVAATVRQIVADAALPWSKICGLGVAVTGVVDSASGVCRDAYILGWNDVPVGELLHAQLGIPVYVDNDTRTLTVAEQHFGLGQNRQDFVLVTIGRGIGIGAVIGGELLRGHRDVGAEFGHLTMALDGPVCPCGKRGCLEAFASDVGLVQRAHAAQLAEAATTIEILTEQARTTPAVQQLFTDAGTFLGIAIAHLINLLGPELVVLTGEGLRAGDLLLQPLMETLPRCVFGTRLSQTEIAVKPWDATWEPWARGAASLVLDQLLRLPLYEPTVYTTA